MGDNITRPDHYCKGRKYEPKDVIRDWGLNFNLGSAVKYISRAGRKGDKLEDLKKAKQFLEFEIEAVEKGTVASYATFSDEYVNDNIEAFVREVLNGVLNIDDNFESDETRKKIIDRIVERINNDELECFDIPGNLYCGYQDIRDALCRQELRKVGEEQKSDIGMTCKEDAAIGDAIAKGFEEGIVRGYTDGNIHAIGDIDTAPDECKDRLIDYLAQDVLDSKCDIDRNIPTDELRKLVIDRIVERINNGELKHKDIPSGLYMVCRKIRAAFANREYRKAADAIRKYAKDTEDTEDTVSINFEFEVDPDIDTDTVNVHVHIKNKED